MSATSSPQDHTPGTRPDDPGDIPAERPAALDHRDVLTGTWEMEARFGAGYFGQGSPAITGRGQRHRDHRSGRGAGHLSQHYYDSRGVARVYQMTLDGREWKIWREAPGFWQCYTGVISDDGTTITGAWEGSPDGREWKHDFGLTYIKTGSPA